MAILDVRRRLRGISVIWVWLFAIAFAALPVIAAALANSDIRKWIPVYIAGGMGGIVLELLLGRWQLELPSSTPEAPSATPVSSSEAADDAEEETDSIFSRPTGRRVDLGFFGRFITGGLGAVTLIILGAVVLADETIRGLQADAGSNLTIAWALAIGAASPAVWRGLRRIAVARVAAVRRRYVKELSESRKELQLVKKGHKAVLEKVRTAQTRKKGTNTDGRKRAIAQDALEKSLRKAYLAVPPRREDVPNLVGRELAYLVENQADQSEGLEAGGEPEIHEAVGALEVLQAQLGS